MSMFLTEDEVSMLTGRKVKKLQVEQLRKMGVPFYVNAVGRPVVVRSALEGRKEHEITKPKWQPKMLQRS